MRIQEWVVKRRRRYSTKEIARSLDLSPGMVVKYTEKGRLPTVNVAIAVYLLTKDILFPYCEQDIITLIKEM